MGLFSPPRITFEPIDFLEGDQPVKKIRKSKQPKPTPSALILDDEADPAELIERWDAILKSEGH